jgi:16S rRNA (guanine527-N7)-methyltransferase
VTLDAVARSFALGPDILRALARFADLVQGYEAANVSGARGREEMVERLVGDSLALLDVDELAPEMAGGRRFADLGTGAGLPGIPLAIAAPWLSLTLVESVGKKCRFLENAVATCGVGVRVSVACGRSERLAALGGEGREAFAGVFAKALGPLATVVELAAPLLEPGGVLLASKTGRSREEELPQGEAAGAACGLALRRVAPLPRSPLDDAVCVVFAKTGPAPDWLPRREGLARARPLGR